MPVKLESFLAAAQNAVIPDAPNPEKLNQLFPAVIGTLNLDRQAQFIEYDDLVITMAVTATPVFSILSQAIDSVSRYHWLAVSVSAWVANEELIGHVEYPGIRSNFVFFAQDMEPLQNPPLGNPFDAIDLIRKISTDGGDKIASPRGSFLDVYPRGILRVYSAGDQLTGTQIRLQYIREVLSVQNSVDKITGSIVGFQA